MTAKSRRARGTVLSAESSSLRRTADKGARTPDSARTEGQRLLLLVPGSLTELTARLGAGRSTVSDWRRGAGVPGPDARARLHAAYGIPVRAWDLKPQGETPLAAPAAPHRRLTPERLAQIEAEDAEALAECDEQARHIPDHVAMYHPITRDVWDAVLGVLAPHPEIADAVINAVSKVEGEIQRDGWRPWRRPTPTPDGADS